MSEKIINELIEKSKNAIPSAKGGNKKCYIYGEYALLEGVFIESEVNELMRVGKKLQDNGVHIARTLDYKLEEEKDKEGYSKGYTLQEKAKGTTLHNFIHWSVSGTELEQFGEKYMERIFALSAESQDFYDKFVGDWTAIQKAGIRIDPSKITNFYYEQGKQITFIDLDGKMKGQEITPSILGREIANVLVGGGNYSKFTKNEGNAQTINKNITNIFEKMLKAMEKSGIRDDSIIETLRTVYPNVELRSHIKPEDISRDTKEIEIKEINQVIQDTKNKERVKQEIKNQQVSK